MNISCQISNGKMFCRHSSYINKLIIKGEPYIRIEMHSSSGRITIGVCKEHVKEVFVNFEEAMKELHIRNMTGI